MRQQKTSKKNRTSYIYYSADGTTVTINPGEDGVTEAHIAMLHQTDDDVFNAERRENYHVTSHYQADRTGDDKNVQERDKRLEDPQSNPEEIFMDALTKAEQSAVFKEVWDKLLPQQRNLILKKAQGRTNVDIAVEEGVSEAAIRNRLKKIQEKFKNPR